MSKKVFRLLVANNALLEAPAYEPHFRGSNWLAIIDVDASAPGGLSRRFLPKGKGECLYNIEQLSLFDAVEFGADYTTSTGRKHRLRWYGVVKAKTDGALMLEQTETGSAAVIKAKKVSQSRQERATALRAERDELIAKAAKLEQEIGSLEEDDTGDTVVTSPAAETA